MRHVMYRGTSLIRKKTPVAPYGGPRGVGVLPSRPMILSRAARVHPLWVQWWYLAVKTTPSPLGPP